MVGARPQFIKAAPVCRALRERHEEILVHTGQHFDTEMSEVFFTELGIPKPDYNLGVGGGGHGAMTGRMLGLLEELIAEQKPDVVLVYGDTNSTLAGGLAAAKLQRPGRARRGGSALLQPLDARGDQPGRGRSRLGASVLPDRHGGREPAC